MLNSISYFVGCQNIRRDAAIFHREGSSGRILHEIELEGSPQFKVPSIVKSVDNVSDFVLFGIDTGSNSTGDMNVQMVDFESNLVRKFRAPRGIRNIDVFPNKKLFVAASRDHFVSVFDINNTEPLKRIKLKEQVWGLKVLHSKRHFAAGDYDSWILVHDYEKEKHVVMKKLNPDSTGLDCVYSIDEYKDSETLVLGFKGTIVIFDVREGKIVRSTTDEAYHGLIFWIALDESCNTIVTLRGGSAKRRIEFFDTRNLDKTMFSIDGDIDNGYFRGLDTFEWRGEKIVATLYKGVESGSGREKKKSGVGFYNFKGKTLGYNEEKSERLEGLCVRTNLLHETEQMDLMERKEYLFCNLSDLVELNFTIKMGSCDILCLRVLLML